jgi:hypothetical protein
VDLSTVSGPTQAAPRIHTPTALARLRARTLVAIHDSFVPVSAADPRRRAVHPHPRANRCRTDRERAGHAYILLPQK